MKIALAVLALCAGLLLSGCSRDSAASDGAYTPLLAPKPAGAEAARGTLKGDFDWAASAANVREAANRWEKFLQGHKPANGEYNDAFQKRHVDAASYELMRVSYLLGEREKADKILKELDPLQLQ
jgi:hypothetical protein